MFAYRRRQKTQRKVKVKEALKLLTDEEAAVANDERSDEGDSETSIRTASCFWMNDKIASRSETGGAEVSRAAAARPAAARWRAHHHEIRHDQDRSHLFIASGALHLAKPTI